MIMNHAAALDKIDERVPGITRRISATWAKATRSDVEAGACWYLEAEGIIDRLSGQTGHSREKVAAVLAHLSPRTTWSRTVAGATSLLLVGTAPGCMGANVARARLALASDDPLGTLHGPKTARFARNMLGDHDAVTVDVWALRVALGDPEADGTVLRVPGVYEAIEHCFQAAARRAGVTAATMQATTWIVARNGRAD